MLKEKKIIVGVCSSIALYKVPMIIRALQDKGAVVEVVMTKNATKLMSPQVFQAVTGKPVYWKMFAQSASMSHLEIIKEADLVLICPATANFLAKLAYGLADDLLASLVLATKTPILICPAMNTFMWQKKVVQENVKKIISYGYHIINPEEGKLACEISGIGRLAGIEKILGAVEKALTKQDLKGKKFLITAGPTIEKIDPVRFLSNFSSGKMGLALAKEAVKRGAEVILISNNLEAEAEKWGIKSIKIESAKEMLEATKKEIGTSDYFISAAAVSDFRPKEMAVNKIKKSENFKLELVLNEDILQSMSKKVVQKRRKPIMVGFALETEQTEGKARQKFKDKGVDLLIVNGVKNLGSDYKKIRFFDGGKWSKVIEGDCEEVAEKIIERVIGV